MAEFHGKFNKLREENKTEGAQTVLEDKDFKLLAVNETHFTRADILKMHVSNLGSLGPQQRRQVYEKIQNVRSMHARQIFLKELNMLGWQFKNKVKNPDPVKASLENIS
jgi:hypothetical protein